MRMKVIALSSAILLGGAIASAQTVGAPIQRLTDASTGLEVRVSTPKPGVSVVEVSDATVSIRKELSRSSSTVTMATPGGEILRIALAPTVVVIEDGRRSFRATPDHAVPSDEVLSMIRNSPAAKAGRALLSKLTLDPKSAAGNVLLLTRALLEASEGKVSSAVDHQRWARATAAAPRVVRVSAEEDKPGDCWYEYARYAVEVFDDYQNCLLELHWYDLFGEYRCDAVYILRAELAFMWLMNCSGPIPWK